MLGHENNGDHRATVGDAIVIGAPAASVVPPATYFVMDHFILQPSRRTILCTEDGGSAGGQMLQRLGATHTVKD